MQNLPFSVKFVFRGWFFSPHRYLVSLFWPSVSQGHAGLKGYKRGRGEDNERGEDRWWSHTVMDARGAAVVCGQWTPKNAITLAAQQVPQKYSLVSLFFCLLINITFLRSSLVFLPFCFQHLHVWVLFHPFLLTSLVFFLSCFLEPWWRWSREAEPQLGLHHRGEADTNYKGKETAQKKVLKLSRIYQLRYFFCCLHGCHGPTDLCYFLNWPSWIWFLETHQSLESTVAL